MPLSVTTPGTDLTPINDCYGSQTVAFGTAMLRLVPPGPATARACVGTYGYTPAGTAHTMTMMPAISLVSCSTDAAAAQAVISLTQNPTAFDGTIIAANDFISFQNEDGSYSYGKVSSVSGLNITLTASLSKKVLKNAPVWFHGAPSDHTDRAFTMNASILNTFVGGDFRLRACSALAKGEPILVHVDNVTATGVWNWLGYYYD